MLSRKCFFDAFSKTLSWIEICLFVCLFVLVGSAVLGPNTKVRDLMSKRIAIHYVHHILPESCALGVAVVNCCWTDR